MPKYLKLFVCLSVCVLKLLVILRHFFLQLTLVQVSEVSVTDAPTSPTSPSPSTTAATTAATTATTTHEREACSRSVQGLGKTAIGQEVGIPFWGAQGAHELTYSHVHICIYYVNLQHMILFYLCIIMCCSLDIARCVYHVCLSFSNLHFAKNTEVCSIRRSPKTCFVNSRRLQLLRLQHPSLRHMIGTEAMHIHKTRRKRTHCRQLKKRLTRTAQVKKERDYCGTHSMIVDKLKSTWQANKCTICVYKIRFTQ